MNACRFKGGREDVLVVGGFLANQQHEVARTEIMREHFGSDERDELLRFSLGRSKVPNGTAVPGNRPRRLRDRRDRSGIERLRQDVLDPYEFG